MVDAILHTKLRGKSTFISLLKLQKLCISTKPAWSSAENIPTYATPGIYINLLTTAKNVFNVPAYFPG